MHKGRKPRERVSGFTLLELLISLAIFSIIAAVSYTSFIAVNRSVESNRRNEDLIRELRGLFDRLDSEIASAFYGRNDDGTLFRSRRFELNGKEVNDLLFTTVRPVTIWEYGVHGGVRRIEYVFDESETEGLVLIKRVYGLSLPPGDLDEPDEFVVCDGLDSFQLRFQDGGGWFDDWDTDKMNRLPDGIELTITLAGGGELREYFNVFISEL